MSELELDILHNWKIKHNIKYKYQYTALLEAYRRVMKFKNSNVHADLLLLSTPSEIKKLKNYFKPFKEEIHHTLNWYSLTDEGKYIINDLISKLKWNESRMNEYLFNNY